MPTEKTVTLTWSKLELQMIVYCLSRCLPRTPLRVSSDPVVHCCPTCAAVLLPPTGYCSECGQSIDWDTDTQWARQLSDIANI